MENERHTADAPGCFYCLNVKPFFKKAWSDASKDHFRNARVEFLKGMRSVTWYAMVAPPATPTAVREGLNAGVAKTLADPATRERFGQLGLDVVGGSVGDTAQFLQQETLRWQKLIKDAHVTLD